MFPDNLIPSGIDMNPGQEIYPSLAIGIRFILLGNNLPDYKLIRLILKKLLR